LMHVCNNVFSQQLWQDEWAKWSYQLSWFSQCPFAFLLSYFTNRRTNNKIASTTHHVSICLKHFQHTSL
jgi:hypothetical protein